MLGRLGGSAWHRGVCSVRPVRPRPRVDGTPWLCAGARGRDRQLPRSLRHCASNVLGWHRRLFQNGSTWRPRRLSSSLRWKVLALLPAGTLMGVRWYLHVLFCLF